MSKNTQKFILPGFLILLGIVLLVFLLRNFSLGGSKSPVTGTIKVTQGNKEFTIDRSGNAIWSFGGETKSSLWSRDKTNSFFDYIFATYGASEVISVGENDELMTQVFSEGSGGGGSGGSGSGDVSQYLESPTPSGNGGGGSGGSGSGGGSGGGGGGGGGSGGAPEWCHHWKLSYCADTPPPSYSPTASPVPTGGPTPLPPDCNDPGNQQTGRTVIGNELCLPSPTP